MSQLFLIRHGQAGPSGPIRCWGRTDVPLTAIGVIQAQALRARLANERLRAIWASDLSRALDTARAIAEPHGIVVASIPELREIDFGEFEGLTADQIAERFPNAGECRAEFRPERTFPGGESALELLRRVESFTVRLRCLTSGAAVVVAHGGSLRALLCALFRWDPVNWWRVRIDLASVSVVELGRRPVLRTLNDICHLEGVSSGD